MSAKKEETSKDEHHSPTMVEVNAPPSGADASEATTTIIPVVETTGAEGTTYYQVDVIGGTSTMFLQPNENGDYEVVTLEQDDDTAATVDNNQRVFTVPIGATIIQTSEAGGVENTIVSSIASTSNNAATTATTTTTTFQQNTTIDNNNISTAVVNNAPANKESSSRSNSQLPPEYQNLKNPQKVIFEGQEYPLHISKAHYKPDPKYSPFTDVCRKRIKEYIRKGEVLFLCREPKKQIIQIIYGNYRIANLCNVQSCILSPKIGGQGLMHIDKCWEKRLGSTAKMLEVEALNEARAEQARREEEEAAAKAKAAKASKKKKFKKWVKPMSAEDIEMAEQEERAALDHSYMTKEDTCKRAYRFTKLQKVEMNSRIVKAIETNQIPIAFFNKDEFCEILQSVFNIGFWAGKNYPQRGLAVLKNEVYHRTYLKKMMAENELAKMAKVVKGQVTKAKRRIKSIKKSNIKPKNKKKQAGEESAPVDMVDNANVMEMITSEVVDHNMGDGTTIMALGSAMPTASEDGGGTHRIELIHLEEGQVLVMTEQTAEAIDGGGGDGKTETIEAINILQNMNSGKWY